METTTANGVKLTERERAMVLHIVNNEYSEGGPNGQTWDFVVCGTRSLASVFGSLVRKGLATSYQYDAQRAVHLTDAGRAVYAAIQAEAAPAVGPKMGTGLFGIAISRPHYGLRFRYYVAAFNGLGLEVTDTLQKARMWRTRESAEAWLAKQYAPSYPDAVVFDAAAMLSENVAAEDVDVS